MKVSTAVFLASVLAAPVATAPMPGGDPCAPAWIPTFGQVLPSRVTALGVFDDGSGPALIVAGHFLSLQGHVVNRIARWDGTSWSPLGGGVTSSNSTVNTLAVFDDGSGPALYAGGYFFTVGGVAAFHIARWDGSAWSAVGGGVNGTVSALCVHDDGSGPALYVGGGFDTAGGIPARGIARWDGASWSPLRNGLLGGVGCLAVFDEGQGPVLFAGGGFETSGGGVPLNGIGRWDGDRWSALTSGVAGPGGVVDSLALFDPGSGPALYVGGLFGTAGGLTVNSIARWDGAAWSGVGGGTNGVTGNVFDLAVFDDGTGAGSALYAMGGFQEIGGVSVQHIARWNGQVWAPLGGGLDPLSFFSALAVFDDGDGPALYAGGSFTVSDVGDRYLARWRLPDVEPPVLQCPAEVVAYYQADGVHGSERLPNGRVVTFAVQVSDDHDPAPVVVCTPPSGSFLPRGTTMVTCVATDCLGHQSTCTFPVRVRPRIGR